jgi:uncharacterized protein involved in exopolysaccharide biosynthesis
MAAAPMTPRDKLQRLVDLGKKSTRFWWLVAAFAVVGSALTLTFVLVRPKKFQSYAVLFYQERIQTSLLSNREEVVQRNIGDRYRELLLARGQLHVIVTDPQLDPFPDEDDIDLKIDKMRERIRFESRGANAFRIAYVDEDAERAKLVTEKLTRMLQEKDEFLRNEQAKATVSFALEQKEAAQEDLSKHELALAQFLAKHPEFAQDAMQAAASGQFAGEGASIRAARDKNAKADAGNVRLFALERQRRRIQARLEAPPDSPPIRIPAPHTPEKIAAEAEVSAARNELTAANRELASALTQYTDQHPAAIRARDRIQTAQARLKRAQAAVPPDVETAVAPQNEADRAKLRKELAALESQIEAEQKRGGNSAGSDAATDWVVQLETEHSRLRRIVIEERERVEALANSVFRAQMDANQKLAETGGRLSVVDPAFKPVKPTGPGRALLMLAGMALFLTLGSGLAVGMAVIDDRVYRRTDLESLGVSVLGVIPRELSKEQLADIDHKRTKRMKRDLPGKLHSKLQRKQRNDTEVV